MHFYEEPFLINLPRAELFSAIKIVMGAMPSLKGLASLKLRHFYEAFYLPYFEIP
jgi:hypothetical protein